VLLVLGYDALWLWESWDDRWIAVCMYNIYIYMHIGFPSVSCEWDALNGLPSHSPCWLLSSLAWWPPMNFHVFIFSRRVKPPVMARSECVWIQNFFAIRLPSGEMAIYSGFSHEKLWFSIAMLVHQRVMTFQIIPQNLRNRDGKIWILWWNPMSLVKLNQ